MRETFPDRIADKLLPACDTHELAYSIIDMESGFTACI